jgi:hypothetical protein
VQNYFLKNECFKNDCLSISEKTSVQIRSDLEMEKMACIHINSGNGIGVFVCYLHFYANGKTQLNIRPLLQNGLLHFLIMYICDKITS